MYEVWYNRSMKIVGHLTPKVIKTFDLDYKPGEEITLSAQRKKHMEKHRQEFSDFDAIYERIPEIIAHPDLSLIHIFDIITEVFHRTRSFYFDFVYYGII